MLPEQWDTYKRAAKLERLDKIPMAMIIDGPWIPGHLGIKHMDYYLNPDLWFASNLKIMREFPDIIFVPSWWMEYGMAAEPSILGAKIKFGEDNTPSEYHTLYRLEDIAEFPEYEVEADAFAAMTLHRYKMHKQQIIDHGYGQSTDAPRGASVFDCAEGVGIPVPTSCRKNGKCKECIVEVAEGMDLLSAPAEHEAHLRDKFRLSCQCFVSADAGEIKCHTMRRGQMRIERHALGLPTSGQRMPLEPAVTRDGDCILLDGVAIDRSAGPIHGVAMDLGTTTCVLRLINLETGELVADASFENPQRFGGSDVMSRIQYDTDHKGKLLLRTRSSA